MHGVLEPVETHRQTQPDGRQNPPPTVSIGLPVYNGADYLAETLDSILGQTYADFELIICDNASTDATETICRMYADRDPRIIYHRQPENLGACRNYDMTFHMSRGRYFKWAAHDDLLAPEFLEKCVAELDAHTECILAYPRTILIDAYGTQTGGYLDLMALDSADAAARMRRWLTPSEGLCNPVFGLIRRSEMAKTGLHGDYPSSDRVFLAEIALRGRVRAINEGLFLRRMHEGNSVASNPDVRDLYGWFTGRRPQKLVFKRWRLLSEYIKAIHRVRPPVGQRLGAYRVVLNWAGEFRTSLLKEAMVPFYMNGRATRLGVFAKTCVRRVRNAFN